jgi:hypothetical protein
MELDTGSAVTILNERTWRHVLGKPRLENSNAHLSCYAGHRLKVLGEFEAEVKIHGKTEVLYATVVKTGHSSLLGRDWLQALKLDWSEMFAINSVEAETTNAKFEVLLPTIHDVFKVTAQGTTGLAPSELRRKRQRCTRWKMRPDVGKMVEQAQKMKTAYPSPQQPKAFNEGDQVWVRSCREDGSRTSTTLLSGTGSRRNDTDSKMEGRKCDI